MNSRLFDALFASAGGSVLFWKQGQPVHVVDPARSQEYADSLAGQDEWLFHVATHDATMLRNTKGYPYIRGRIESAQDLVCLWADVDLSTKDEKYPTPEAVEIVFNRMGVEPSALINSGNGLHAYWILNQPVSVGSFKGLPKQWQLWIKELINEVAAELDTSFEFDIGADLARALRVPGTINLKHGSVVQAIVNEGVRYDPEFLSAKVPAYIHNLVHSKSGRSKKGDMSSIMQSISQDTIRQDSPTFRHMLERCAQVYNFANSGGDVSEPEWYDMAGVFLYVQDGENIYASISEQAHGVRDTDRSRAAAHLKLDQRRKYTTGPTTCARLSEHRRELCKACPFFGSVTSPIQVGRDGAVITRSEYENQVKPVEVTSNELVPVVASTFYGGQSLDAEKNELHIVPEPFEFDDGKFYFVISNPGDTKKQRELVSEYPMYFVSRVWDDTAQEEVTTFEVLFPNDSIRVARLHSPALSDPKKTISVFVGLGVLIPPDRWPLFYMLVQKMIRQSQNKSAAGTSYSKSGWFTHGDERRFILGNYDIGPNEVRVATPSPKIAEIAQEINSAGTVDGWREGTQVFYNEEMLPHRYALLVGFAVPFLAATDYAGMVLNLMSAQSGTFKSFTLKSIASIYGVPSEKQLLVRDSAKSQLSILGARSGLPTVLDEITNIQPHALSDLCYSVSQGRASHRLTQNSDIKKNDLSWQTILISSSNQSLPALLSAFSKNSKPEMMRTLEISIPKINNVSRVDAQNAMQVLRDNHGRVGIEWLSYVVKHWDALSERAREYIKDMEDLVNAAAEERFWATLVGLTNFVAHLTYKLGFHSFDVPQIEAFGVGLLENSRRRISSIEVSSTAALNQFLNEHTNNTVTIKGAIAPRIAPSTANIIFKGSSNDGIYVRYEPDMDNLIYVDRVKLRQWCTEARLDFHSLVADLAREGAVEAEEVSKRLGIRGVHAAGVRRAIVIKGNAIGSDD